MEEGKLVKPNVLNKPVQDASDLIRSKQKKQESRARGEYELRTIMKKITTIAETRGSHWLFLSLASSLFLLKYLIFKEPAGRQLPGSTDVFPGGKNGNVTEIRLHLYNVTFPASRHFKARREMTNWELNLCGGRKSRFRNAILVSGVICYSKNVLYQLHGSSPPLLIIKEDYYCKIQTGKAFTWPKAGHYYNVFRFSINDSNLNLRTSFPSC